MIYKNRAVLACVGETMAHSGRNQLTLEKGAPDSQKTQDTAHLKTNL